MSNYGTQPYSNHGTSGSDLHVKQQQVLRVSVRYLKNHDEVVTKKGVDNVFPDQTDAAEKQVRAGDALFSYVRGSAADVNEAGVATVDNGESVPLVFNHMSGGSRTTRTQFRGIAIESNTLTDHDTDYQGALGFTGECEAWFTGFTEPRPGAPICCAMVDGNIDFSALETYTRACKRGKLLMGHWYHLEDMLRINDPGLLEPANPSDYVVEAHKALHRPMMLYLVKAAAAINESPDSVAAHNAFRRSQASWLNNTATNEDKAGQLDAFAGEQIDAGLKALAKYVTPQSSGSSRHFTSEDRSAFNEARKQLSEIPSVLFQFDSLLNPDDYDREEFRSAEDKRLLFRRKLNRLFDHWMSGFRRLSLVRKGGMEASVAFAHYLGVLVTAVELILVKYTTSGAISGAEYKDATADTASAAQYYRKCDLVLTLNLPTTLATINTLYALNCTRFSNGLDDVLHCDYVGMVTKPLNQDTNLFAVWMEGKANLRA